MEGWQELKRSGTDRIAMETRSQRTGKQKKGTAPPSSVTAPVVDVGAGAKGGAKKSSTNVDPPAAASDSEGTSSGFMCFLECVLVYICRKS